LGLAEDGGLFIPCQIPTIDTATLASWSSLSFVDLAVSIFRLYIDPQEISTEDLKIIVSKSFSTFSHSQITPLVKLPTKDPLYVLELFHGPTFAFKDVALQFLGNLFEFFLKRRKEKRLINVVGATSGDTGGAAIYGLRGKDNVNVFILHPKNRISPVQEAQMTSVLDANIHNIAVEGTFDDCQDIVKTLFSNASFRKQYHLAAINSINWARILAQITYYFYSYYSLLRQLNAKISSNIAVQFSVPTGNFGDILAGYFALRMGLPIHRLITSTNENDILHRFFETGKYQKEVKNGVDHAKQTLSPAMDILVSSNFERLLWFLARGDGRVSCESISTTNEQNACDFVKKCMQSLKETGGFSVSGALLKRAKDVFSSARVSDQLTMEGIRKYYHEPLTHQQKPYVLDPHTSVGVMGAEQMLKKKSSLVYTICLSTASPGKFPEAVLTAINKPSTSVLAKSRKYGFKPLSFNDIAPKALQELDGKPTRCIHVQTKGKKETGAIQVQQVIVQTVQPFKL
jgi:threonine synthase